MHNICLFYFYKMSKISSYWMRTSKTFIAELKDRPKLPPLKSWQRCLWFCDDNSGPSRRWWWLCWRPLAMASSPQSSAWAHFSSFGEEVRGRRNPIRWCSSTWTNIGWDTLVHLSAKRRMKRQTISHTIRWKFRNFRSDFKCSLSTKINLTFEAF